MSLNIFKANRPLREKIRIINENNSLKNKNTAINSYSEFTVKAYQTNLYNDKKGLKKQNP